jgi:hypothetical protein
LTPMRKIISEAITEFVIIGFGVICLLFMVCCFTYFMQNASPQDKEDVTIIWLLTQQ